MKKEIKHKHKFELSRIETIPTNQGSDGASFFYKKIAYIICPDCGEVKQQDI